MCERETEFCDLLIFRSSWKWSRFGNCYLLTSQGVGWFFGLLPRYLAFYISVLLVLPSQLKQALHQCTVVYIRFCVRAAQRVAGTKTTCERSTHLSIYKKFQHFLFMKNRRICLEFKIIYSPNIICHLFIRQFNSKIEIKQRI